MEARITVVCTSHKVDMRSSTEAAVAKTKVWLTTMMALKMNTKVRMIARKMSPKL